MLSSSFSRSQLRHGRASEIESTLQGVKSIVQEPNKSPSEAPLSSSDTMTYSRLLELAATAHRRLLRYGSGVEIGLKDANSNHLASSSTLSLTPTTKEERETLRGIGRNIWMTVRAYPDTFGDREDTASEEILETNDRVTSSGYIRLVAARLVLLDWIGTKSYKYPTLIPNFSTTSGLFPKELEFGLRTFSRAGRAILSRSTATKDAYCALLLSSQCWDALHHIRTRVLTNDEADSMTISAASIAQENIDDAFDVFLLLPDAAHGAIIGTCSDQKNKESNEEYVEQSPALRELKGLESFVKTHCIEAGNEKDDVVAPNLSLASVQRYLPSLARTAYKHGSRFAKLGDFESARRALEITLRTTNQFLAEVSSRAKKPRPCGAAASQAILVQEEEIMSITKGAFYVMTHVCHELEERDQAFKCLGQVEKYINEQKIRGKKQRAEIMSNLEKASKSRIVSSSSLSSGLSLEEPKQQDKVEIKTRVEAMFCEEKRSELKEYINLAFTRIKLYQGSEDQVDNQFKRLVELSLQLVEMGEDRYYSSQMLLPGAVQGNDSEERGIIGSDAFHVMLRAAREIRTRRLVAGAPSIVAGKCVSGMTDPYQNLLDRLGPCHSKIPLVVLDSMSAILTAIQILRQKAFIGLESTMTELDELALSVANRYLESFNTLNGSSLALSSPDGTTVFQSNPLEEMREMLLERARATFSRALALYHGSDDKINICHRWADHLIATLEHFQDKDKRAHQADYFTGQTQSASEEILVEVLAIKAYCLSESGEYNQGLRIARKAWTLSERSTKPTVHIFGVMFHAAVLQETNQGTDSSNNSCDALLELDNALTFLVEGRGDIEESSTRSFIDTNVEKILEIFPALCKACLENEGESGGRIQLGVKERWIKLLIKSKSLRKIIDGKQEGTILAEGPLHAHGKANMLTILRSYLEGFESVVAKDGTCSNPLLKSLESLLEGVLSVLRLLRDRNSSEDGARLKKRSSKEQTHSKVASSKYELIWDDPSVQSIIGEHTDCICIAEQLWSTANLLTADQWTVSLMYANAHDFALLSEEEEDERLSGGFLASDYDVNATVRVPDFARLKMIKASSLSSEFSAQCLLLSVAHVVDDMNGSRREANNDWKRLCLHRLALALDEIEINELQDEHTRQEVKPMLAYLTLRCLVELGDDDCALSILTEGSLLKCFCEGNTHPKFNEESDKDRESIDESRFTSMLRSLYAMASRTEAKGMNTTTVALLRAIVAHLEKGTFTGAPRKLPDHLSVGAVQRKLIQFASSVNDTVSVFEDVNKAIKEATDNSAAPLHSTEQLDWFTIEAYNRGMSLVSLGDTTQASRLVAIALNLLPYCSKSVLGYGPEMRNRYGEISSQVEIKSATLHCTVTDFFGGGTTDM